MWNIFNKYRKDAYSNRTLNHYLKTSKLCSETVSPFYPLTCKKHDAHVVKKRKIFKWNCAKWKSMNSSWRVRQFVEWFWWPTHSEEKFYEIIFFLTKNFYANIFFKRKCSSTKNNVIYIILKTQNILALWCT